MRRVFLLVVFSIIFLNTCPAQGGNNQGTGIIFRGKVLDAATLKPVGNTQIMINNFLTSVSGTEGEFSFYVNKNDTVKFTSLGYKIARMTVSDTLKGQEYIAGIFLQTDTLLIDQVIIIPRFINLRSELTNGKTFTPSTFDNARYNVAISAYQGKVGQNQLGNPADNYAVISNKQKVDASERGGIPSDKILGLSPLLIIPAAYLLVKGLPEKPEPYRAPITNHELDLLNQKYLELISNKK